LSRIEPYGFIILVVLLATGLLGALVLPVIGLVQTLLIRGVGLPADLYQIALRLLGA
jgi:hypothetical protein